MEKTRENSFHFVALLVAVSFNITLEEYMRNKIKVAAANNEIVMAIKHAKSNEG